MSISPDSLLRLVRHCPIEPTGPIHVLGVDDWAWHRNQRYGTLLVDLERSRPVDLLPDRTAETLAHWLQAHPGIDVISRDRAGAYAEGARQGAPKAVQVADRWHLLRNLADTLERLFDRLPASLRSGPVPEPSRAFSPEKTLTIAAPAVAGLARPLTQPEQMRQARRTQRRERFETVLRLHQEGVSQGMIVRQLKISPNTIRRYLNASTFLEIAQRPKVPSILDPFTTYLAERWSAGCHNGFQLWREIRERGYRGSRQFLSRWVANQRQPLTSRPPPAAPRPLSSRQATFLVLKPPEKLDPEQAARLARLCEASAEVATASRLARAFAALLRGRMRDGLEDWLQTARASGLRELKNFADGLQRDYDAVAAGLSLPWSNGPTEGHITRLKLVKRQMFGRANFDLLRQRVLLRS
jgi:transposase